MMIVVILFGVGILIQELRFAAYRRLAIKALTFDAKAIQELQASNRRWHVTALDLAVQLDTERRRVRPVARTKS